MKNKRLSVEINYDSFQLYDESESIFNQISISDYSESESEMVEYIQEKAIENGI